MSGRALRIRLPSTGFLFLALLSGCAGEDPPNSVSADRDMGLVGIVAAAPAYDEELQAFEDAAKSRAASSAAGGVLTGAEYVADGVLHGGALGLLFLPAIPIMALVGGVAGGIVDAARADEIEAARSAIVQAQEEFFMERTPAEGFSEALILESRQFAGYRLVRVPETEAADGGVSRDDVDTLAIVDAEWLFRPVDLVDSRLFLELVASVQLPSADGGEPITHQQVFKRGPYSFEEWGENDARKLRDALQAIQEQMAHALFTETFAIYRAPKAAASLRPAPAAPDFRQMAIPLKGFWPLQPEYRITAESMAIGPNGVSRAKLYWVETPALDTLKPLLAWEPLPGTIQADPFIAKRPYVEADGKEISKFTYDLMIFCPWLKPVYRRSDLAEPRHQVEEPLPAGEKCTWSVRAKFEMDGRTRITDWGQPLVPIGEGWPVEQSRRGGPEALLYRFNFYTPDA